MNRTLSTRIFPVLAVSLLCLCPETAYAGAKLKISDNSFINFGAGIRVGFRANKQEGTNDDKFNTRFARQNTRLYFTGQVSPQFKFTVNTEVFGGKIDIMDAVARYEPHPAFNIWFGRMLTPAERVALNGPFNGLAWNQYTVPLYPSGFSRGHDQAGALGRDEGVTIWGAMGKFVYAVGVFDGYNGARGRNQHPLFAGRFAYNFLNRESKSGYYTRSTYHGKAKDVLTLAVVAQAQKNGLAYVDSAGFTRPATFAGVSTDLLFEKVFSGDHVLTMEGEFKFFHTSYDVTEISEPVFTAFEGTSFATTAGFMVGPKVGPGQFQPYGRFNTNMPKVGDHSYQGEFGLNYVIDGHNMRVNLHGTHGNANFTGYKGAKDTAIAVGVQVQI